MNLVFAGGPRMTETGSRHKVDANGHLLLAGVEVHLLDEPRVSDTKSSRKQVVDLVRHFLSTEFANPSKGHRTTAARVQRSQRVNRRSSACGFMDGGRGEKSVKPSEVSPPTTPQAQQQQSCISMRCNLQPPTRSLKEAKSCCYEKVFGAASDAAPWPIGVGAKVLVLRYGSFS